MKKYWKKISLLLLMMAVIVFVLFTLGDLLTFEALKKNSAELARYVQDHYVVSFLVFAAAFLSTAFFVPGALILTISSGYFFGAVQGALYASLFSTAGATLAFLASRYLIGTWVQTHYKKQLKRFNEEIASHGSNYLFVLRVIPVMPAFLINYLSGLTRILTVRYIIVSFLGIVPGAVVYAMAGRQLATIESPEDILSVNVLIGFSLLALFALMPVIYKRLHRVLQER